MTATEVLFGVGVSTAIGAAAGLAPGSVPGVLRLAARADRNGLGLFSVSDHPYVGGRFDAYAAVGVALGGTSRISGPANVSNLPSRPAPMLARTVTSLSALTGGRIVLGLGAGGLWDAIVRLAVPRLDPAAAVRALEESVTLIRALSGGGPPVTFEGEFRRVHALEPAPVAAPRIWTGSVGPKSPR
ncbi:LLM class flavin-dependent oxidoreductase [Streptomyces sp. IBSBF 2435]|uniref:LLM class flavin-dependent oxidoreductase n=1 Tax=Streptomyces sp. IBSBF 2435 TaxID=2903531 RepID=UPI002FDBB911